MKNINFENLNNANQVLKLISNYMNSLDVNVINNNINALSKMVLDFNEKKEVIKAFIDTLSENDKQKKVLDNDSDKISSALDSAIDIINSNTNYIQQSDKISDIKEKKKWSLEDIYYIFGILTSILALITFFATKEESSETNINIEQNITIDCNVSDTKNLPNIKSNIEEAIDEVWSNFSDFLNYSG